MDALTIYSVSWVHAGYALSAVVIAASDTHAVDLLDLAGDDLTSAKAEIIGTATPGMEARVVVEQSL